MYRTFVILRHTFLEAIVQPIFALLMGLGATVLLIYGLLPFFTLGEDTVMYKSVGLDVILSGGADCHAVRHQQIDPRRNRRPHHAHADEQADLQVGGAGREIPGDHSFEPARQS